jgi:DNA-binding transcriptional MerR regulator
MAELETIEIPNRPLFRQPEVCEIARIQAYVLRSWEAEFPDLGVAKAAGGPRVYRRADVERVLKLKHLLFVEGLTLAGARRKIAEEQPAPSGEAELTALTDLFGTEARDRIRSIEHTLRELAAMLARQPGAAIPEGEGFELRSTELARPKIAAGGKPAKSSSGPAVSKDGESDGVAETEPAKRPRAKPEKKSR